MAAFLALGFQRKQLDPNRDVPVGHTSFSWGSPDSITQAELEEWRRMESADQQKAATYRETEEKAQKFAADKHAEKQRQQAAAATAAAKNAEVERRNAETKARIVAAVDVLRRRLLSPPPLRVTPAQIKACYDSIPDPSSVETLHSGVRVVVDFWAQSGCYQSAAHDIPIMAGYQNFNNEQWSDALLYNDDHAELRFFVDVANATLVHEAFKSHASACPLCFYPTDEDTLCDSHITSKSLLRVMLETGGGFLQYRNRTITNAESASDELLCNGYLNRCDGQIIGRRFENPVGAGEFFAKWKELMAPELDVELKPFRIGVDFPADGTFPGDAQLFGFVVSLMFRSAFFRPLGILQCPKGSKDMKWQLVDRMRHYLLHPKQATPLHVLALPFPDLGAHIARYVGRKGRPGTGQLRFLPSYLDSWPDDDSTGELREMLTNVKHCDHKLAQEWGDLQMLRGTMHLVASIVTGWHEEQFFVQVLPPFFFVAAFGDVPAHLKRYELRPGVAAPLHTQVPKAETKEMLKNLVDAIIDKYGKEYWPTRFASARDVMLKDIEVVRRGFK